MKEFENNALFWQKVDTLVLSSSMKIDRPKGTSHYKYSNLVYPVDYGYLSDSMATESSLIDIYWGESRSNDVNGIVISADILKKDCVVKLLVGCTDQEMLDVLEFLNQTDFQKAILVKRGDYVPDWAIND